LGEGHSRIRTGDGEFRADCGQRVEAPVPLGRMGRRMQEILALAPERRPIDQYAAYAEVAR
jgi:hypothetical protein